jgi:hypothetical protein
MMNNCDVAIEFVKCFCAGDVDALAPLLTPDVRFKGPFYEFGSADAYLDSLKNGPLEKCGYRVLSITESKDSVSIYYDYEKSDRTITIAQLFKFSNQKVQEILLVFDGRGFA